MVASFLAELQTFTGHLSLGDEAAGNIEYKHFFSGAAAYTRGKIFMTLTPAGLALKLPDEDCQSLLAAGAKPLRYFPKAPIKKNYVVVPNELVADTKTMTRWVQTSISYCREKN